MKLKINKQYPPGKYSMWLNVVKIPAYTENI